MGEKVEKAQCHAASKRKRVAITSRLLILLGVMGMGSSLCNLLKARSISKWLLEMAQKGWKMDETTEKPVGPDTTPVTEDELAVYDLMRNMMLLCFLVMLVLTVIGRLGVKAARKNKAKVAHHVTCKSFLLLIPFVLLLVSIKIQAKKFKRILEANTPKDAEDGFHHSHHDVRHLQNGR
jgi:hypothetical protein